MKHKYRTRVQGESLQAKISEIEWKIMEAVMYPAVFLILSVWLWMASFGLFKMNVVSAVLFTIVTVFLAVKNFRKVKELRKNLKNYRKGLEGERYVGEMLNNLGDNESTFVFHDIPADRFNVDHIIVSTRGIFAIETKHYDRSNSYEFVFDGKSVYRLTKNGRRIPCPRLLPQMDGEACFIQDEIEKRTEIKLPVTKVAIPIGYYITCEDNFKDYWFLNEKAFITTFKKMQEVYDESLVKLIAQHIREMVKIDVDE